MKFAHRNNWRGAALLGALLLFVVSARAQVWTDAGELPLYGKAVNDTYTRYSRLPGDLSGVSRSKVWELGKNSAGLYIRFRTDSPTLWVRWESETSHVMSHMSPTGSRGLDLYVRSGGKWRFLAAAKPKLESPLTTRKLVSSMAPEMREYMLFLSLYDGVVRLDIGTDEGHQLLPGAADSPRSERPVVMYGTSITQGGCVSRPGMAYTNILGRELDRTFINLGFSGNALFDLEIARLMASVETPAAYVIAATENARVSHFEEHGEDFIKILRNAHPDVPIIIVQAVRYSQDFLNEKEAADMKERMDACRRLYEKFRKSGDKRIYFSDPASAKCFDDAEQSVDGIHLTDLGHYRFAKALLPTLNRVLK